MNWKLNNFYFIAVMENIAVQMFGQLTYLMLIFLTYNYSEIGVFLAVFTAVTMISEIPSGILVDSIGEKAVLKLSYILRSLGLFFMVSFQNFYILLFTALITGIASALSSGTLESWIVNEIKKSNYDYEIGKLFSKLNIVATFFGLLSGFLGAQFIGRLNPTIPFYVSSILFLLLFLYVSFSKDLFEDKFKNFNIQQIKSTYKETILNLGNVFKDINIVIFFVLFTIPGILDIGPSNQWQVVLNLSVGEYIVGYYVVAIGITTILSNLFINKYNLSEEYDIVSVIDKVVFLDVILITIFSIFTSLFPYLFVLHVFLVGINGTLIVTYIHDKLIKENSLRTSIISSFYSLQALLSAILLPINGILSDFIGISKTWVMFTILSLLIFILLRLILSKRKLK